MAEIRVQDEQGNIHIFPDGSTPAMIAQAMGVKPPPDFAANPPGVQRPNVDMQYSTLGALYNPSSVPKDVRQQMVNAPNPGVSEGAGLRQGLADYVGDTGSDIGGGVKNIAQGNTAKGGHQLISGAGKATLPALPFLAPLLAASPGAAALATGGGLLGQFATQKGAEALGASPDQAQLAGDIGGLAAGYGSAKIPGFLSRFNPGPLKAGASAALDAASQAAGANPVGVEGAGQAALSAQEMQQAGRTMPRVMQRFLSRVTAPNAEPLSYDEARQFYSAASDLSANEKAGISPGMRRQLNQFKSSLGDAIQQTADNAGVGSQYAQGMSDYAKAKRLEDTWQTVWDVTKKKVIPGLIGGGAADAGYKLYRSLEQ